MDASPVLNGLTRRLRRGREPQRLHRWGVATATTADGVTAEIQVEYVLRFTQPEGAGPAVGTDELEMAVSDAVEDTVRQVISSNRVSALPTAGDPADWAEAVAVSGAVVEHAVVARSDVQVTPELRRLVTTTAPAVWT